MIIDFHAHAFDDALAAKAVPLLEHAGHIQAAADGRVSSLLASMDRAGIDRAVVCPIATKPSQFEGIRRWARQVRSDHPRIEMLLSIHPNDPDALLRVDEVAEEGFKGLKFHPYYQDFAIDERRLFPLYERIAANGLLAVFHVGFDIAFPPKRIADPLRVRHVVDAIPHLRFVATHLGGWRDWDEARKYIIGQPIYVETSYSLHELYPEDARNLILAHPSDRILFGTDSPWHDQAAEIARWRALKLPPDLLQAALGDNAARLLAAPVGF